MLRVEEDVSETLERDNAEKQAYEEIERLFLIARDILTASDTAFNYVQVGKLGVLVLDLLDKVGEGLVDLLDTAHFHSLKSRIR